MFIRDRIDGTLSPTYNPTPIPAMTTVMETNNPAQLTCTSLYPSEYAPFMYMNRFKGNNPTLKIELTVVIATLSERSPLKSDVHQFENEPPGELVVIISGTPSSGASPNIVLASTNPNSGKNTNCANIPMSNPLDFSDRRKDFLSTVLAKPHTSKNKRIFPVIAPQDASAMTAKTHDALEAADRSNSARTHSRVCIDRTPGYDGETRVVTTRAMKRRRRPNCSRKATRRMRAPTVRWTSAMADESERARA